MSSESQKFPAVILRGVFSAGTQAVRPSAAHKNGGEFPVQGNHTNTNISIHTCAHASNICVTFALVFPPRCHDNAGTWSAWVSVKVKTGVFRLSSHYDGSSACASVFSLGGRRRFVVSISCQ